MGEFENNKAAIAEILQRMRLSRFFQLKGPDLIGEEWLGANGEPIDCNIYNPKYGNYRRAPVSVNDFSSLSGRSWNDTPMLCVQEDGTFKNKDGLEVFKKKTCSSTTKTAETVADFELVFQKKVLELKQKRGLTDEKFIKDCIEQEVNNLVSEHERLDFEKRNLKLLELARAFLKWMNNVPENDTINYTWPTLFKDPKQAHKILGLLSEHLSSTGQWLTDPKGRHLVALCSELESKGYFKSDNALTNPVKAAAFKAQFDVKLTAKNFQPQRRNDAEGYREHFQHIPHYKSES